MDGVRALTLRLKAVLSAPIHKGRRGNACGRRPHMPDLVRQALDLMLARPMSTLGCAIAAILYVQLMAGPRVR